MMTDTGFARAIGFAAALLALSPTLAFAGGGRAAPAMLPPPVDPGVQVGSKPGVSRGPVTRAGGAPVDADVQFWGIGYAETRALHRGLTPPDMGGAASDQFVVQMVNGAIGFYTPGGALAAPLQTDKTFWKAAGINGTLLTYGASDPRVVFDAASGRFFVCELTLRRATATKPLLHNDVMLAISRTSNPLDGFVAISLPVTNGQFGDFPTLGVNAEAVTLSISNFAVDNKIIDLSVFTLPKADLLAVVPSIARLARIEGIAVADYGGALHAVVSLNPGTGTQKVIGIGEKLHAIATGTIFSAGQANATLSPSVTLYSQFDGIPAPARQPVGKYDAGDDRIGAQVTQVGNYLYIANEVSDDQGDGGAHSDYIHWAIVDATTDALVAEGRIADPAHAIDYTYPAIDANANGRFVIAYNGSSTTIPISAYATVCDFDSASGTASCGAPRTMATGLDGNYHLFAPNRWGDYSAIQRDASNPNAFWLFQEIPAAKTGTSSAWATVVTHLITP